jgi:tRNA-specific 2-thiouridylase
LRVLAALSGGVDSSVAAALLLEQGHEVVGVTLKQWIGPDGRLPITGCCTVADAEDARRVAAQLGIRHYVLDHVADFAKSVVDPFVSGYLAGMTPNPCVECNRRVRFGALLDRTEELGCDVLATGHHARLDLTGPRPRLLKGRDATKDQSYVLHMLGASDLVRIRLPVGEMTKADVRDEAARLGLATATKPESQDLCFVEGDYREFLRERAPGAFRPGAIVDGRGRELGGHDGVADFTVGQRRGLGLSVGEPLYVTSIDPVEARVTVGTARELSVSACEVSDVSFVGEEPVSGSRVQVKVRYRSEAVAALLETDDGCLVRFDEAQPAVAPGQSAVFYRGEEVLGGGVITAVAA